MDSKTTLSRRSAIAAFSAAVGTLSTASFADTAVTPADKKRSHNSIVLAADGKGKARGHYDAAFAEVAREFERNFSERKEVGASACVIHKGRVVVDLWGGTKNDGQPWDKDTIVVVYSCTKGATALCAHLLASRAKLSFDDPVGRYWPAFQSSDKRDITIRMLLNHSAGLAGTKDMVTPAELWDWDHMIKLLEQTTPLWRPGSRWGYHGMTFGYLVGEVVRRVTGESIGTFYRKNIAQPLGADFWIGLPESEEHRVARSIMEPLNFEDFKAEYAPMADAIARQDPIQVAVMNSLTASLTPGACDLPGAHQAEIPAAGGITNARGLATMYAPLACPSHEVTFVTPDQHQQMIATESSGECAAMLAPLRFSTGFEKGKPGTAAVANFGGQVHSDIAFGHSGFGSSLGFADPDGRFSFGYAMNRHSTAKEPPFARSQALVDATYRALGYRSKASGRWSL